MRRNAICAARVAQAAVQAVHPPFARAGARNAMKMAPGRWWSMFCTNRGGRVTRSTA
jgi:hypothetical protein